MTAKDDLALWDLAPQSRITRRAIDATIKTARRDGRLPAGDCAQVAMLRQAADRLDQLRADKSTKATYAEVPAERMLLDLLSAFGLVGTAEADAVDKLLAAMDASNA